MGIVAEDSAACSFSRIASSVCLTLSFSDSIRVLPAGYLAAIVVGSAVIGRDLPPAARLRLPVVFATMHGSWGAGFLTSPRSLAAQVAAGAPLH